MGKRGPKKGEGGRPAKTAELKRKAWRHKKYATEALKWFTRFFSEKYLQKLVTLDAELRDREIEIMSTGMSYVHGIPAFKFVAGFERLVGYWNYNIIGTVTGFVASLESYATHTNQDYFKSLVLAWFELSKYWRDFFLSQKELAENLDALELTKYTLKEEKKNE